jgi:hypothetical protein
MKELLAFIVWIGIVSAILAALLAVDMSPPLKVLLAGLLLILYLIFYQLARLEDRLLKLLYFIRCDYIANEIQRLDPENRTPARDILASDLKEETVEKEIERGLLGLFGVFTSSLAWIILVVGAAIGTALIYQVLRK